jgi:hypothetical protein
MLSLSPAVFDLMSVGSNKTVKKKKKGSQTYKGSYFAQRKRRGSSTNSKKGRKIVLAQIELDESWYPKGSGQLWIVCSSHNADRCGTDVTRTSGCSPAKTLYVAMRSVFEHCLFSYSFCGLQGCTRGDDQDRGRRSILW